MIQLIDLNLMRTLVLLCEKQNINRVAMQLGVSDSAVSKQLARLREQLNNILFERVRGKLEPTEYTLSILPRIKQAVADNDAIQEAEFNPENVQRPIVIAMPSVFIDAFGLMIHEAIQQHFPKAPLQLKSWEDGTDDQILSGEVTLGYHLLNDDRPADIYQQVIKKDRLVVAVARRYEDVSWADIKQWPFIKQLAPGWSDQRFRFINHLKRMETELNYQHIADTLPFALQLMKKNRIANVIPESALGEEIIRVSGSESIDLEILHATCVRLVDRTNPLHKHLHSVIAGTVK